MTWDLRVFFLIYSRNNQQLEIRSNYLQIDQRVVEAFETELRKSTGATSIFAENSEEGRKRWEDLKSRVVEHNIRIMAKYYNRIALERWDYFEQLNLYRRIKFTRAGSFS